MAVIDPNSTSLLSQIQAQLQAGQLPSRAPSSQTQRPFTVPVDEEAPEDNPSVAADRQRRLLARSSPNVDDLSSADELEDAEARVASFNGNLREAPVGRLSTQAADQRDVPLGQIIDIRV